MLKKVLSLVLACTMTLSLGATAFASSAPLTNENSTIFISNHSITEATANKIVQELQQESYDYSGTAQTRSVASKGVKVALKYMKKNMPKITKILKKYGIKVAAGKGMVGVIDDILDGVISVDDSIDGAIYTVLDKSFPGLDAKAKKILANGIRLILPA